MSMTYPQWICATCGMEHGNKQTPGIATWHYGTCDICKKDHVPVTEPRDFGHLKETWKNDSPAKLR
jgi:hypothetical protein